MHDAGKISKVQKDRKIKARVVGSDLQGNLVSRLTKTFGFKDLATWRLSLKAKPGSKLDCNRMLQSRARNFLQCAGTLRLEQNSLLGKGPCWHGGQRVRDFLQNARTL